MIFDRIFWKIVDKGTSKGASEIDNQETRDGLGKDNGKPAFV